MLELLLLLLLYLLDYYYYYYIYWIIIIVIILFIELLLMYLEWWSIEVIQWDSVDLTRWFVSFQREPFVPQVGLVCVRGCEIEGMLDHLGRVIEEGPDPKPKIPGDQRTYRVWYRTFNNITPFSASSSIWWLESS